MSKDDIDELFKLYVNINNDEESIREEAIKKILKYADVYNDIDNYCVNGKLPDNIYRIIMLKIEKGDYKYFSSMREKKETIEFYVDFMRFSSKLEDLNQFAEENLSIEKIKQLEMSNYVIIELLKVLGDFRKYLTPEIIKEFKLDWYKILDLIKDSEFIDEYLFWWQDKNNKYLNLSIANIIKGSGKIEEYLTPQNIKRFRLDKEDILNLIIESKDIEKYLTPEIINELELNSYYITKLVKETRHIEKYMFDWESETYINFTMANLIKATGEDIETYLTVEKIIELNLNSFDITKLIKETGNFQKYLFSWQISDKSYIIFNISNIIKSTGRIEEYLTPEKIRELNLSKFDINSLVRENGDIEKYLFYWQDENDEDLVFDISNIIKATGNIEKYLTPEKVIELGLTSSDIITLIREKGDIKKYLFYWQDENDEDLMIDITNVIKATGNIEKYLESEMSERLQLTRLDRLILEQEIISVKYNSENINLPDSMTIGVEIETEGVNSKDIKEHNIIFGWKSKNEGSLKNGVELVSPILTGEANKSSNSIKKICFILSECNQIISERCGGHIHIGADYLTNIRAWVNLIEIWGNTENLLYIICNKEGEIPRYSIIQYAKPIYGNLQAILSNETVQLDSIEDLKIFARRFQKESRYFGINLNNLNNEKNTIEFRLANGTIDANVWIENINLFGGIVNQAEVLSNIQEKSEINLTEEEKRKLFFLEAIKDDRITQEEKLEALLELTIPEEDRDIYRRRYKVNIQLIEDNPEIRENISSRAIDRKKIEIKKIGKKIFVGDTAVTGQDYQKNLDILRKFLVREDSQLQIN